MVITDVQRFQAKSWCKCSLASKQRSHTFLMTMKFSSLLQIPRRMQVRAKLARAGLNVDVTKHFFYFKGMQSIIKMPCVSDGASRKLILSHSDFVKIGTRITQQISFSNVVNFDTDRFFKFIQLPANCSCFKNWKALFKTGTRVEVELEKRI